MLKNMRRIIALFYNYLRYLIILINDHICHLWGDSRAEGHFQDYFLEFFAKKHN